MGGEMRPPRWADVLLRTCLNTEEAETESGDLLEAYRDSICPARGRWRADFWYVRQVVGYVLRARGMVLRNWLLLGLTLCVLTIVVDVLLFPGLLPGPAAAFVTAGFLFYGYVAACRTHPVTPEDAVVLRLGARYGIAHGALWIAALFGLNRGVGFLVLALPAAFLVPLVAGAHAAIKLWRIRAGMRVGFWSGLISGIIVSFVLMAFGYVWAYAPGLPGAEIPQHDGYTAAEYAELNVSDTLGGGLVFLFEGGVFGLIGGALGGFAGILLARTGRGPQEPRRILWSALACCVFSSAVVGNSGRSPISTPQSSQFQMAAGEIGDRRELP